MFQKKTIRDIEVRGRTVLVRTDYNVPLTLSLVDQSVEITSDFRIRASLPTINYLLEHEADKIILISHLGRPDGIEEKSSLRPVALRLAELLPGISVNFVDAKLGAETSAALEDLPSGSVVLLENLRFDPREAKNDTEFARLLADSTGADLFVLDGFGISHRAVASTVAITQFLPAVAGLLVEKEVSTLEQVLHDPPRPFTVVVGGAKVADKQPLIDEFLPIADQILVGGKIAADGYASENPKIYVADDFDTNSAGEKLDIGPVATTEFINKLSNMKTVLWNGVLGKVEDPAYATSSTILAKVLGEDRTITSVICGGDTTGFVENLCAEDENLQFSLVSTGGGAALELLVGKKLPGLEALEDK